MKNLILIILLLLSQNLYSAGISVGGFSPFVGVYQKDEQGGSNTLDLKPYISAYGKIPLLKGNLFFRPELGHVFSYKLLSDNKNQSQSFTFVLFNLSYGIFKGLYLNSGVGTFWQKIKSVNGAKSFSNGNSTATYYYPGLTVTSTSSTFNLGLEQEFKNFSLSFMTYWFAPLNSEKRSVSYTLNLGYSL